MNIIFSIVIGQGGITNVTNHNWRKGYEQIQIIFWKFYEDEKLLGQ